MLCYDLFWPDLYLVSTRTVLISKIREGLWWLEREEEAGVIDEVVCIVRMEIDRGDKPRLCTTVSRGSFALL
jgi:hypothetical protein